MRPTRTSGTRPRVVAPVADPASPASHGATTAASQEGTRARRVTLFGADGVRHIALPESGEMVLGRGPGADVRVSDARVSRRHLRLRVTAERVEVEDLGSTNGTRLGADALAPGEPRTLEARMPVSIGDALLLLETPDGVRASSLAAPSREAPGEAMGALRLLLRRVARSKISVILFGETGVGKELFAESIHRASARSEAAFVRLNCAALPEALLESELFGYERGAFTGAVKSKPGLLEWADGGSLFLDEIGEMPPATQAKLLRVLENGELTRLGGLRAKRIDVRVVCATHRNLLELVGARSFREDLYFRLNGITITVPPLRERTDEILPLAEGFLREASRALGEAAPLLTPAARDKLLRHRWPGNVRELRNTIDRAVVLASGQPLMPDHLALGAVGAAEGRPALRPGDAPAGGLELKDEVRALERHRILEALEATGGNQTRAAQSLNIPRRTLLNRLDAYGILRPRKRAS